MIAVILNALLPVVVTLELGTLAGWHRDHDVRSAKSLNRMVLVYALPLALFAGTVTIPRPELLSDWPLLAVLVAGTALPFAAALLVDLFLVHRTLEAAALQAMVFGNARHCLHGAGGPHATDRQEGDGGGGPRRPDREHPNRQPEIML